MDLNALRDKIKGFFDLSAYLIPQSEAEESIREGVTFRGINIFILIVAIFIASLGLNTNSTAVIIGAMLISPLMGPIIGIGLAVGIHDFDLMKRSFRNLLMATTFSIATACLYFMISPVNESHSELLARTSPTIYDVFIGFFGGAAGILAIGSKNKGNVIPGVAIATALMPPLCTVGYGLATLQWQFFLGALYLFFINSVFIALATFAGVKLMKYHPAQMSNPERALKVRRLVYTIAILTMIPSVYLTYTMYLQNTFQNNASRYVEQEFTFPDTQVLNYHAAYDKQGSTLTVTLMGRQLPQDSLLAVMDARLPQYGLTGTYLRIIQGSNVEVDVNKASSAMLKDMYAVTQATISAQQATIDSLHRVCEAVARTDSMGIDIAPELKVLFPQVEEIAINRSIVCSVDSAAIDTLNVALVSYVKPMNSAERTRFREYLQARLKRSPIKIVDISKD